MTDRPRYQGRYDDESPAGYRHMEHRPALDELKRDHLDLLSETRRGFYDRREVVMWLERVSVRTFGLLPSGFFEWIGGSPSLTAIFINDAERRNAMVQTDEPFPEENARALRDWFVESWIDPACADAFRYLAEDATEYNAEDAEAPDPDEQGAVAMRPVLADFEDQQTAALRDLLDGEMSSQDVVSWVAETREATDRLLPREYLTVCRRHPTLSTALGGGREWFHLRAQLAVSGVSVGEAKFPSLLRLMNEATREVAQLSNEGVELAETPDQTPLSWN
ncbi:hypothetical protein [Halocalculus aciditolerans]|uniref:Uncharacterized protein n=1 Tax=Halocalculus aciditolerans TaxID=1383812 RepID=A0A830F5W7_9EURY|nr:hypothetical protein [Halocalculus aciditolerans]GGL57608.1 hypothetical protein GCM10009039_14720 [Halocalculus aciditolerans]